MGLSVNNKQKVRQAMVKISNGGGGGGGAPLARYVSGNGLTIGALIGPSYLIDDNVFVSN